jgi:hypothetical protein
MLISVKLFVRNLKTRENNASGEIYSEKAISGKRFHNFGYDRKEKKKLTGPTAGGDEHETGTFELG